MIVKNWQPLVLVRCPKPVTAQQLTVMHVPQKNSAIILNTYNYFQLKQQVIRHKNRNGRLRGN